MRTLYQGDEDQLSIISPMELWVILSKQKNLYSNLRFSIQFKAAILKKISKF